ncbi:MAG: hypothetical protein AAGH64_02425, partial [Planctomycetota bacterium]
MMRLTRTLALAIATLCSTQTVVAQVNDAEIAERLRVYEEGISALFEEAGGGMPEPTAFAT